MTDLTTLLDTVQCMDALELLRLLPDESIDLVVTSPPYNLGTTINGAELCSKSKSNWGTSALLSSGYDTHNDAMPYSEYIAWQRLVVAECVRVIKTTGAIFIIKNGVFRAVYSICARKSSLTPLFAKSLFGIVARPTITTRRLCRPATNRFI